METTRADNVINNKLQDNCVTEKPEYIPMKAVGDKNGVTTTTENNL